MTITPALASNLPSAAERLGPRRDRLFRTVADLCAMGEKVSGTDEEKLACDYLVARLAELGVAHRVHVFDSYISYPLHTALTLLHPEQDAVAAVGIAFTRDTGDAGVEAELAYAGGGGADAYRSLDAAGKIVLVDKIPTYGTCQAAARAGAVGLIGMSSGPQRHKMTCSPVWGTPSTQAEIDSMPDIASASISRDDGMRLRALIDAGPVRVRLVARVDTRWREVRLPVAEIPGTEPEFLLMGAHYCTWFDGATDNIAADAILLEMARIFGAAATRPRYGLRLAWWPGHTQGRYAGSAWYADRFWNDLHEHAIAYFNIDINGSRGAHNKAIRNQTGEVAGYTAAVLHDLFGPVDEQEAKSMETALRRQERYVHCTRPHRNSDQSFWGVGLSALQVSSFLRKDDPNRLPNSGLAWWWHTEQDTVDNCDPDILVQDAALHAHLVDGLVNASRLPFDLRQVADDMSDALRELIESAPDLALLDDAAADIAAFKAAAQAFHEAGATLSDPADTASWNRRLLRAVHRVNPVLYQASSPYQQDTALSSRLLPGLRPLLKWASLSIDEKRLLRVGMQREYNRIAHALADARRTLAA